MTIHCQRNSTVQVHNKHRLVNIIHWTDINKTNRTKKAKLNPQKQQRNIRSPFTTLSQENKVRLFNLHRAFLAVLIIKPVTLRALHYT